MVTWYKVSHVTQWDFQNNESNLHQSILLPFFVLEVPLYNLCPSMADFVACDRIVQRAYSGNWVGMLGYLDVELEKNQLTPSPPSILLQVLLTASALNSGR